MKFRNYIKDKYIQLLFIVFTLVTIEIFLMAYRVGNFIKIYIPVAVIITYLLGVVFEFMQKKKYYDEFMEIFEKLEEKYLIINLIKKPEFLEGKILNNILEELDKSMIENVNKYKFSMRRL